VAKADVLALAQIYAKDLAHTDALGRYYTDGVRDFGKERILLDAYVVPVEEAVAVYDYPVGTIRIFDVFFGDRWLSFEDWRTFQVQDTAWQTRTGTPRHWYIQDEERQKFRLYPAPDTTSANVAPTFGEPLGRDYPSDRLLIIASEQREDVPLWFESSLAFLLLSKEFQRESDHQDMAFAKSAGQIGNFLLAMVSG
jgi:hypothetical protein